VSGGCAIALHGVVKDYGALRVLDHVDLEVPHGSLTAILGASGSGKTTLLRLVAGFNRADAGTILVDGEVVDGPGRFVTPQRRSVGYVPQEAALFPHLDVLRNVAFGIGRAERGRARELIALVGLEGLERRYPHELSGGQQRRVAIARALAIGPRVVLLDEPFSSLDAILRAGLRRDVMRILGEAGATGLLVTHDQDEALSIADQVVLLREGVVAAAAAPRSIYDRPPDLVAASAIGEANVLRAELAGGVAHSALGEVAVSPEPDREGPAWVLIRPEQLELYRDPAIGSCAARVLSSEYHGHDALAEVVLLGDEDVVLTARVPGSLRLEAGETVWLAVDGPVRAWVVEPGAADPVGVTPGGSPPG
jgi:iron(III) transport system ATP-binding protein